MGINSTSARKCNSDVGKRVLHKKKEKRTMTSPL